MFPIPFDNWASRQCPDVAVVATLRSAAPILFILIMVVESTGMFLSKASV